MKNFVKIVNTFAVLALGYFLVNLVLGLATISTGKSLLAVAFFFILSGISAQYMKLSERELSERELALSKIQTEVIKALDKSADLVYVIVAKRMHPKAGVYYDVVTGTDLFPFEDGKNG